jgi:hypothetical protein
MCALAVVMSSTVSTALVARATAKPGLHLFDYGGQVLPFASRAGFRLPYQGGPVLHSSSPYLIFWTPPGESIPASSEALMQRYFTDVAAASGKSSNAFGVLRQYYDHAGFADYRQSFDHTRQVIVDTQPYPARDTTSCTDVSAYYPRCISDAQIRAELQRLIKAKGLPTAGRMSATELPANAPIYFVVLPADVEVCTLLGVSCDLIAYHDSFVDNRGDNVLYAAVQTAPLKGVPPPPPITGPCDLGGTGHAQEPNGNPGDCAINSISHEDSETITDPTSYGWFVALPGAGFETGDACNFFGLFDPRKGSNPNAYMPTLGGRASAGTLYTQLINGHPYYTQSEWSNGNGNCEMRPSPGKIVPRFSVSRPHRVGTRLSLNPAASTSTQALSSATWKFGDGSGTAFRYEGATLDPVKHRYKRAGSYTVTLTLVDNNGNLQSTTHTLVIK